MSATAHLEGICLALTEHRPIVLLLGQDAWRNSGRADPVLKMALRRAGRKPENDGFSTLLQADPLPPEFYDWLAENYFHQPQPTWLEWVARLPLNAVFTSSVDPALARAFRTTGREIEAVLSKHDNPIAPRDRRHLHMTYLFGRAGEHNPNECPPSSSLDLRRRTALHATALLSRIVETTTSLGILLIDGLSVDRDWLSVEALSGILSAFSPGQVYWFGWNPNEPPVGAELLQELAAPQGPIIFVAERLSVALSSLELANKIDISSPPYLVSEGAVRIRSRILEIDPATRLKASTAASIVEDTWIAPLAPLGADAEYIEFRRFHGHVEDARRLVEGLRRGYAIERDFEADLKLRVSRALLNAGRRQGPVLIHGQSGSGKSLALARLAYQIREEGRYPVLLSSRATRMPSVEEIDDFCLKAEEAGAEATLVICDVNMPMTRYGDLLRGFVSRGRRVVVVGSAYRIVDDRVNGAQTARNDLIEVPAEINDAESKALVDLIAGRIGVNLPVNGSSYLLPAIYRILPDVRPRLAAGLAQEARIAEGNLRVRGKEKRGVQTIPTSSLGIALTDAGLLDPKTFLDQQLEDFIGTMSDTASRVIDFVMVPGKLDCAVPVNLLMRAVGGGEHLVNVATLFSGIDLFRWSSNDEDDVFIHPRLRVEAELIVARRLGTAQAEAEVALRLLEWASPGAYGSCERRFVLDLVHKLGPDGPLGRRFANHYLDIARALTDLRLKRGLMDPSLMLQEATLRRRVLRDASNVSGLDPALILDEARQIVELALDEFGESNNPALRRACANLKVERAAIYGFRAVQQLKSGVGLDEVWKFYEGARDSARNAVYAADSYHAIDISVWVPSDLLDQCEWGAERRAELIADIWDGMERVDPSQLDHQQQEWFEERRVKAARILGDNHLEQDALAALNRIGSKAGIFMQAREIGGSLWGQGKANAEDVSKASKVITFMNSHREAIRDDVRCLRYWIRSFWLAATGSYFFGGERAPLPEHEGTLHEILSLLESLDDLEGVQSDPRTLYLRAVLMWRLRREGQAREMWNFLGRETAFSDPRRVVRQHLWTESGGQPRLFHGRVIADSISRGRIRIQVDELNQEVELLQRDFPSLELRRNATVQGGFHIAFNFIGPVADSPRFSGAAR